MAGIEGKRMSNFVGPFALVIPNGIFKNGSDVFNILDPDVGGASTFTVQLSADGQEPPTYWGANSRLSADAYNALVNMTTIEFKAYNDELAVLRGRAPVGPVPAFKNGIVIGAAGEDFWGVVAGMGLRPIE